MPHRRGFLIMSALVGAAVAACTSGPHSGGADSATARLRAQLNTAPSVAPSATTSPAGARYGPHPARAQASGAPYPTPAGGKVAVRHQNQSTVLNALPGTRAASCAPVGDRTDMRSGAVAAGNFVVARKSYVEQVPITEVPTVFLYLIPEHAGRLSAATVRVANVASGTAQTVTSTSVQQAEDWRYFALQIPVRSPGRYRLTMTAGEDRGCFELTFKS